MGPLTTPSPLPPGWEATAYPGAQPVIVEQFAPTAVSSGEIAIIAILLFGFALVITLLLFQLLKRTR